LLWHVLLNPESARRQLIVRSAWLAAAAAAWAVYFLLLKHFLNINSHDIRRIAFNEMSTYRTNFWIGWYYALRGGWILPVAFVLIWLRSGPRWPAWVMAVGILPIFAVSTLVGDISRVSSMAFPAFLIATIHLYRRNALLTNHLLIASLIIQIFSPIWSVVGLEHRPYVPLPVAIIQEFAPAPQRPHPIPATQTQGTKFGGATELPLDLSSAPVRIRRSGQLSRMSPVVDPSRLPLQCASIAWQNALIPVSFWLPIL
jgi:hypothetical protein